MTSTAVAPINATAAALTSANKGADATSSTSSAAGTSSASAGALSVNNGLASLAGNFQSFLTLLTTQLRNQNPLNPTDTNQFTQQITQMTGVEQQLISNQLLQQLVAQQSSVSSAAGLIGDKITAPGPTDNAPPISGVVTAVTQVGGKTLLTVGDAEVPLSAVTSVSAANSNPLAALLGG
jgi:flagellar basal-body rod modification protein FlgD